MLSFDGHSFSGMGGGRSFQEQASADLPLDLRGGYEHGVRSSTLYRFADCSKRARAYFVHNAPSFCGLVLRRRPGLIDTLCLPKANGREGLSHNIRCAH